MDGEEVVTFGLRRRKSRRSDLVELDEALGFVAAGRRRLDEGLRTAASAAAARAIPLSSLSHRP